MADSHGETRDLAAELALGVALGEERAGALQHLETCADCRREVAALTDVADELLLLAPQREPPVGFESRVVARIPRRPGISRWRRFLSVAAVIVVTGALVGSAVWYTTRADRQAAALLHTALERAGGQYLGTEFLHDPEGTRVGHVVVYRGTTSWIFAVVEDPSRVTTFDVEVVTRDGEHLAVGTLELTTARPGGGLTLPVDLLKVASIRLRPGPEGDVLTAELPGR